MFSRPVLRIISHLMTGMSVLLVVASLAAPVDATGHASTSVQIDLVGPPGSNQFGFNVTVLPNDNIVVTDPGYSTGTEAYVGAVYLYDGATLALISTLTGSHANDQIGSNNWVGLVQVLPNGNYVVTSPFWNNGAATSAGAVTLCNGTTGCTGEVSAANSLVGIQSDVYGSPPGVQVLPNSNYVVTNPGWDNGAVTDAGAATWCNGTTGCSGEVTPVNSLVGTHAGDHVGAGGVAVLANGNYVVQSPDWANGAVAQAGAATWCSGTTGCSGEVTPGNSLVGAHASDKAGWGANGVAPLPNGNYVVQSQDWANGAAAQAGAATWCSGTTGCSGEVTPGNSLVGTQTDDNVSSGGLIVLTSGNYVVRSLWWNNGTVVGAGAVTWCSGTTGCTGEVSAANSLVGSTADDLVGEDGVVPIPNGNYLVQSLHWDNGSVTDAGAVTWCSETTGCTGAVAAANSLVGTQTNDNVGSGYPAGVWVLPNGNYVVLSPDWDNGTVTDAGAATWCSGTTGCTGAVAAANSLVGSTIGDQIGLDPGEEGLVPLPNGDYVLSSPSWYNGGVVSAGAVTWCSGITGCTGVVSAANSLVGTQAGDRVGERGVLALPNGNYVVSSATWHNGGMVSAGAVTWCSGITGCMGAVTAANSLVGTQAGDNVGWLTQALPNGNYVVSSKSWNNGTATQAGAVTWCSGTTGCTGAVTPVNSLVGTQADDDVGWFGVVALTNGNFVVASPFWNNGTATQAGAVTWCSGTTGCTGEVTTTNSLVGSHTGDKVGTGTLVKWGTYPCGVHALSNGNYVVSSPYASAVTWGDGIGGITTGPITHQNSVLGSSSNFTYNYHYDYLIVDRPYDNIVTIFYPFKVYLFKEYLPLVVR